MADFLLQIHAFRLYLVALPPEELEQVQTSLKIFSAWWHKERTVCNKALLKEPWAVAQPIKQTRWADALVAAASRAYIFHETGAKGELVKWSG